MKKPTPLAVFFIATAAVALVAGGVPLTVNALAPGTNRTFVSEAEEQTAINALDLQIRERLIAAYPESNWPASLSYVGGRVSTPDGLELARLPLGTALEYTRVSEPTCGSGGNFELLLVGPDFGVVPDGGSITWSVTDWAVWGTEKTQDLVDSEDVSCGVLEIQRSD